MASAVTVTPEGRPSMTAMSSGTWDSPAVSTRSMPLVFHDRRPHDRHDDVLLGQQDVLAAMQEDADLPDGLVQQHVEPRDDRRRPPAGGEGGRPGGVRGFVEHTAG